MLGRAGQQRAGMETAFEERGIRHCFVGGEVIPARLDSAGSHLQSLGQVVSFSVPLCPLPAFLCLTRWLRDSCCIHGAQHRGTLDLAGAVVGDKNRDLLFVFYTKISP